MIFYFTKPKRFSQALTSLWAFCALPPLTTNASSTVAPGTAFFRSLTKNPWDKLYDLLRDSTFYFCAEKGTHVRHSVPYSDYYWLFSIHDNCSYKYVDEFYRRGTKQSLKDLDGSYNEWDAN